MPNDRTIAPFPIHETGREFFFASVAEDGKAERVARGVKARLPAPFPFARSRVAVGKMKEEPAPRPRVSTGIK